MDLADLVPGPRSAGILLHPTSLPAPGGSGDLGPGSYRFLEFLTHAGQSAWQILPLGPPGFGGSPYAARSAFAGNELLISPALLVEEGLLDAADIAQPPLTEFLRADFAAAAAWKERLLRRAFARFCAAGREDEAAAFRVEAASWLDDYALYRALHRRNPRGWWHWPAPLARRDPAALARARHDLGDELAYQVFVQWLFWSHWRLVRLRAHELGISIIGDIPIFPARDSADVWANQSLFKLDPGGAPTVVAGVPPDYFSKTGQRWGNPLHDWGAQASDGFAWWIDRFRWTSRLVDVARLDHFRGFEAAWEIPAAEPTAVNGRWVPGPGLRLFERLREALPGLRLVAEDLGVITDDVRALHVATGFPGMRVLQFAFDGDSRSPHLPHNHVRNTVAYTGTHDNDTTAGWLASLPSPVRDRLASYAGLERPPTVDDLLRLASASVAATAIVPMQDVLGLGSVARMNTPASETGNWRWRFTWDQIPPGRASWLRTLATTYGRAPAQ